MATPVEVLCAGIVVADHVCAPISHVPAAGELVMADEMILAIGGCAANVAVDLAKLNVRPGILGRVGDDAFGRLIVEMLGDHLIETSSIRISKGRPTSQTMIVNVRGQDRRFVHTFGANSDLTAADMPLDQVRHAKVLYLGGYLLMPEMRPDTLIPVFQASRAAGGKTVLDVATPGKADYLPRLEPLLPHVDVFVPNHDEAATILGERDPFRQAQAFRNLGVQTAIITMGSQGAMLVDDRICLHAGVYSVPCVDSSGGGDAFAAGYIYGMLHGMDAEGCLRVASALGASCVRAIGTTPGVFRENECLEFIRQHELPIRRI